MSDRADGAAGRRPIGVGLLLALSLAAAVGACGGPAPSNGREPLPTIDPAQLASGVVDTNGTVVTRRPLSRAGLIIGVPYVYTIPTCEADTPIDFDGSLWDIEVPAGVSSPASESGVITMMSRDTATFRAGSTAYSLQRHEGTKDYQPCH